MTTQTTPSPLPFLLLGLVTGGALLYVSYWVWPPGQRRNDNSAESRRLRRQARRQALANADASGSGSGSGQATSLRRSNATRRSSRRRPQQSQQPTAARRDDNRHYTSGASSSDDEDDPHERSFRNDSDEEGETTDHEYAAIVDEDGYEKLQIEDLGDNKHEGLQLMNLLYAIAEDQAGKEGHIHRGITCNSCRTVPIRGLRYKCANCQDYDLCEGCEAAEVHTKSHVFMKIRIPIPPLANSRTRKLAPFYPGTPQAVATTPQNLLQDLLNDTHFDNVELDAMYNQYLSLSTLDQDGGGITRLIFEQALGPLGLEKNLITERIFRFFDQDNDGIINFREMACGLSVLCKGNFDEKIDFAFQGYDLDGDGYISREELHEMFKAYFYLSMELIRDVVKTMENDLMTNFEYQPGQPISSTFTAPIPREIGVRSNNNANRNHANNDNTNTNSNVDALDVSSSAPVHSTDRQDQHLAPVLAALTPHSDVVLSEAVSQPPEGLDQEAHSGTLETESLPSGAYGLVGSDAFADDEDEDDETDQAASIGTNIESITSSSPDTALADTESLLPVNLGSVSDSSEAEDSGVESNSWNPADAVDSTPSPPEVAVVEENSALPNAATILEDIPTVSVSSSRARDSQESTEQQESNGGSNSRIRKDQPLPALTVSPHLMGPTFVDDPAWERPHRRTLTSASTSSDRFHTMNTNSGAGTADIGVVGGGGPSLAPALSIGFGADRSRSPQQRSHHAGAAGRRALTSIEDNVPFAAYSASSSSAPPVTAGSYANASYFSSTFPVMESISQDAIQEMVEKTFGAIKNPSKPGFITLEEFRAYVLTDAGILGWFDALGSIF
ncbi:hypothetical protein EMPS_06278 [Entomortierella parvispora]|uniref:Uncharacterized protein n=1 Tax=Entomortierella parvispora TaxID=205924 RepID=A0A9P3HBZ8_9FUNG|nr:hypothetical protein EMPS_06278 [Entomortierella parvispora]